MTAMRLLPTFNHHTSASVVPVYRYTGSQSVSCKSAFLKIVHNLNICGQIFDSYLLGCMSNQYNVCVYLHKCEKSCLTNG